MSREWAPGDVALYQHGRHDPQVALRVPSCPNDRHADGPHWHLSEGGWTAYDESVRPLVVIDPAAANEYISADETVVQMVSTLRASDWISDTAIADQIEQQWNPTPPKPDEPTGLGAVVEDRDGDLWLRTFGDPGYYVWRPSAGFDSARTRYREIDAVRVLSQGVTEADR